MFQWITFIWEYFLHEILTFEVSVFKKSSSVFNSSSRKQRKKMRYLLDKTSVNLLLSGQIKTRRLMLVILFSTLMYSTIGLSFFLSFLDSRVSLSLSLSLSLSQNSYVYLSLSLFPRFPSLSFFLFLFKIPRSFSFFLSALNFRVFIPFFLSFFLSFSGFLSLSQHLMSKLLLNILRQNVKKENISSYRVMRYS